MTVFPAADHEALQLAGRLSADPLSEAGAACSVRIVRIAPGPRTPHRHPHSLELMYVVQGEGTTWEGDVDSSVAAGDVVLVPAGAPHVTVASGPGDLVLVCFFPHPDLSGNTEELAGPVRS
jgi:quercetin dioxygenase-like cupin family protein